jgi:predicted dehydrogenase
MFHRRYFLQSSLTALALNHFASARSAANEKLTLGVIGVRGRGKQLIQGFTGFEDVEIGALCDPDENTFAGALKALPERHKRIPKTYQDMRKVFDDKSIDAVIVATPDHWHALATIWAAQAGKHVYVEKPVSHNVAEGRRMIEVAEQTKRVVAVGTQRRSAEHLREAAEFVRKGGLGKVPFARTWIAGARKTIGKVADGKAPEKVDYNLWLGPAPERPFNANRFHYNWHWFWDYGTGELGNNGIHGLDVIRLLLGLDAPMKISSGGGKYFYDDDQETPDTQTVTFDFANCSVLWEHRIWAKTGVRNQSFGIELVGEKGTLVVDNKGWHVEDIKDASGKTSPGFERAHYGNFLECIKSGKTPNASIEEGHKSTRLCHLGNIAWRLGRTLKFDAKTETIVGDKEANAMLSRKYRKGFELA